VRDLVRVVVITAFAVVAAASPAAAAAEACEQKTICPKRSAASASQISNSEPMWSRAGSLQMRTYALRRWECVKGGSASTLKLHGLGKWLGLTVTSWAATAASPRAELPALGTDALAGASAPPATAAAEAAAVAAAGGLEVLAAGATLLYMMLKVRVESASERETLFGAASSRKRPSEPTLTCSCGAR
jgi:hypothetical protein